MPPNGADGTMVAMDTHRTDRARRLGQVKFMVLELPPEAGLQETAPAPADSSRAGWLRRLLGFLPFRVPGRLEAARP